MGRQARLQSPTGYYHVMMRGNNKEKIFSKDQHKKDFLDCLKEQWEERLIDIVAYCIMDNHIHVVVRSDPLTNLSVAVKRINTRYAMNYNQFYGRTGHVFQSRYKSEIIADDAYLLNVIRYVHNNPVKAGMVKEAGSYYWSSFNDYIKSNRIVSNAQKRFVLEFYNNIHQFINFHRETDRNEYLDTPEDIKAFRVQAAREIISAYIEKFQVKDIQGLKMNPIAIKKVIRVLLDKTKLSHRQIAGLLKITNSLVHRTSLKD